MSSNKFKNNRESIEAKANELGISFEELLELKNEFKVFSNKVETNNKNIRKKMIAGGRNGGKSVSSEKQSIKAKIALKVNLKRGNIHNKFIPAGNAKQKEMIESGEWSKIAIKGGHATAANWDGQKEHMRSISTDGRKAAVKVIKQKAISKNQRRLNELSNLLELNRWYTAEEIIKVYPELQNNSIVAPTKTFRRFALRNEDFFEVDYSSHQTKKYKLK
jgi:hypothetical protein